MWSLQLFSRGGAYGRLANTTERPVLNVDAARGHHYCGHLLFSAITIVSRQLTVKMTDVGVCCAVQVRDRSGASSSVADVASPTARTARSTRTCTRPTSRTCVAHLAATSPTRTRPPCASTPRHTSARRRNPLRPAAPGPTTTPAAAGTCPTTPRRPRTTTGDRAARSPTDPTRLSTIAEPPRSTSRHHRRRRRRDPSRRRPRTGNTTRSLAAAPDYFRSTPTSTTGTSVGSRPRLPVTEDWNRSSSIGGASRRARRDATLKKKYSIIVLFLLLCRR